jgi:hypothetical protein
MNPSTLAQIIPATRLKQNAWLQDGEEIFFGLGLSRKTCKLDLQKIEDVE